MSTDSLKAGPEIHYQKLGEGAPVNLSALHALVTTHRAQAKEDLADFVTEPVRSSVAV